VQVDESHLLKWQNVGLQMTFKPGLRNMHRGAQGLNQLFYRKSLYSEHLQAKGYSPSLKHRLFSGNEQYLGFRQSNVQQMNLNELMGEIERELEEARDRTQEYFESEGEVISKWEEEKQKTEYLEFQLKQMHTQRQDLTQDCSQSTNNQTNACSFGNTSYLTGGVLQQNTRVLNAHN